MKLRNILAFCLCVLLLCAFCSCGQKQQEITINFSPTGQTITDLATTRYTDQALEAIVAFRGSFDALCAQYPAECVRQIDMDTARVCYLGNQKVVVIPFSTDGTLMLGHVFALESELETFLTLRIGDNLTSVRAIDPQGNYPFLYTGTDSPKISTHCTTDGYYISITYDDTHTIVGITIELI